MSKELPSVTRISRRGPAGKPAAKAADSAQAAKAQTKPQAKAKTASADKAKGAAAPRKPSSKRPAAPAAAESRVNLPAIVPPPPLALAHPADSGDTTSWRHGAARDIISRYTGWAVAGGLLPVPFVDIVAVSALQVRMIGALAELYDIPFTQGRGRAILSAIVGGVLPQAATGLVVSGLLKSMPGVALGVKIIGGSALSAGATRVVGDIFFRHFEDGGSLTGIDVDAMRQSFRKRMAAKVTPV